MHIFRQFVQIMVLCIGISSFAMASTSSDYQVSRETVERTMAGLVTVVKETTFPDDSEQKKNKIRELVEENLDPVVDFRRIVKRIMGKHFKNATKEQRNDFLSAFRNSLVNTYGSFILNSNLKEIVEKLSYEVLPLGKQSREGMASVNCIISFDSDKYELIFSMYYNESQDKWLMQNLIVEGINLGINYRTQFDRLMTSYRGDVDKVIAEWTTVDTSQRDS